MQDKYFVDTNIFLYSILEPKNESEQKKEKIALDFLENESLDLVISIQVINEITNTLFRKTSLNFNEITEIITQILDVVDLIPLTIEISLIAMEIKERYSFSFYDSLIVSAAFFTNCHYLITEDLQHQQIIVYKSNQLQVINPFL